MLFDKSNSSATFQYNHKGFTLAETLITLVIIGVVAALTIPNLIIKHQKEETVAKLKKVYSTLSQATEKSVADNGPIYTWEIQIPRIRNIRTDLFVEQYLLPYLNVTKNCGYNTEGDCHFEYATINDPSNKYTFEEHYYKLILPDGTVLNIIASMSFSLTSTIPLTIHRLSSMIYCDLNGKKGPNILGKDIFVFHYSLKNNDTVTGKFIPYGGTLIDPGEYTRDALKDTCSKNGSGLTCAALIMADGWQIKDDYPW